MEPVIVIENHIPFIKGVFDNLAQVRYLPPEEITAETMRDADALITRTRTRCNSTLLDNSKCKIIATATIGTDHIDLPYCESHGIKVVNAPGCNAPAVAQYVMAAILHTAERPLDTLTLGIIGVGLVGTIVDRWARSMGMKTILCDPPRAEKEGDGQFVTLDTIADQADIITVHTPHAKTGKHPTHHLLSDQFFNSLKLKPVIINSARGPIADTQALINALDNGKISAAVIDCWENEPNISSLLLEKATIATPHIAGYSKDGKIRATVAAIQAVADHLGLKVNYTGPQANPVPETVKPQIIRATYNPMTDTAALKASPEEFENQRNNYNLRQEP